MRRRFCHSSRNGRARRALVLLVAAGSLTAGSAATADKQLAAVLKTREVNFVYRSTVNLFACDELRNNVAVILRALGARDDVQVRVNDCEIVLIPDDTSSPPWDRSLPGTPGNPGNPVNPADRFGDGSDERRQFSTVHVQLMFPVEATPEIMKEIDKDKSRRDLISRVTGNAAVALNDPIVFPAERKEVTLSQQSIRLRPEHCELLEQMSQSLFRQLDIKVISKQLSCDRYGRSHFAPKVTVEVLWPVGTPLPGEK
jgi:hypothetical protein